MRHLQARVAAGLLSSTALCSVSPAWAQSLPSGASVVSGGVAISSPSSRALSIQQSTPTAIVNWQGFSIGAGNAVTITQPSSSAAILNRVTSSAPSTLAGQLDANGQVYLVNPNGIAITKTGVVNAAGFVASTLDIGDDDFRNGRRSFQGNGASAAVTNAGTITIGRGGYAALIGGTVDNSGTISVPLGKVGLGSGEAATLDLSGDGFLQVTVPTNAGGKDALIKNSGKILANGGRVVLQAATLREAARNAINISGVVEAHSISGHSGAIVIGGGPGGNVKIAGRVDASGAHGANGGRIAVAGHNIHVSGRLLASGASGGTIGLAAAGKVKVSGRLQAEGSTQSGGAVTVSGTIVEFLGALVNVSGATGGGTAQIGGVGTTQTRLDAATTIKADATGTGNGGAVTIWSGGNTTVNRLISARGGPQGGDGGKIETSGQSVDFAGVKIDTSAPAGQAGLWLVDPTDLTVDAAAAATISANLASTNVTLETTATTASGPGVQSPGNGDITIAAPIGWASGESLTLDAYHAIAINAPIIVSGAGKLNLTVYNDPTYGYQLLAFGNGANVQFTGAENSGQALNISGQNYTLLYTMGEVQNMNANLLHDYALAHPLDATNVTSFTPIGSGIGSTDGFGSTLFRGRFQGLGNTISNLVINQPNSLYVGLFGAVGLTGAIENFGLLGGAVSGLSEVGGLAGLSYGKITRSYATGAVNGAYGAGGLVGFQYGGGSIVQSYATGAVNSTNSTSFAGGLVGDATGSITQSYATGAVIGGGYVGGLVGFGSASITQSYATGAVNNTGAVYGTGYAGGLVGYATGSITQSYATGAVTGPANATLGGLVGKLQQGFGGGTISASYWDVQTSGIGASQGVGNIPNAPGVTGLTTAQFSNTANFAGWSFGTTPSASGWVIADADGSFNNAGGAPGATRPILLSEYSTNIVNGHQLQLIGLAPSANYTLAANIDLGPELSNPSGIWYTAANAPSSGSGFAPIGNNATPFTGTFDGQGHTISNLAINQPNLVSVGLFGVIGAGGTVENLGLIGGTISGVTNVGALAGSNAGIITNVSSSGTVAGLPGNSNIGGLVGANGGTITFASAGGAVSGSLNVGGLAGDNFGTITQSSATGPVGGFVNGGGLVGRNEGTITSSSATGGVSGAFSVGGLVGENAAQISQSYATGSVTGLAGGTFIGGFAGANYGAITLSSATGGVSGGFSVGGFVGENAAQISQSYATGSVTGLAGGTFIGSFAGANYGAIAEAYATGAVSGGASFVGGLVGNNSGTVTGSY